MGYFKKHPKLVQFMALLIGFFLLVVLITPNEANVLWRFPSLLAWLPGWINALAENLMFNWFLIEVYDSDLEEYENSALIREVTRGFSRSLLFVIELIREILIPTLIDQHLCAQSRMPIDMIRPGWSVSLFQASQQWATMSS